MIVVVDGPLIMTLDSDGPCIFTVAAPMEFRDRTVRNDKIACKYERIKRNELV